MHALASNAVPKTFVHLLKYSTATTVYRTRRHRAYDGWSIPHLVRARELAMMFKWFKYGVMAAAGSLVVGGLMFGSDLMSYLRSSARSVRQTVKDQVPVEFELKRARELIDNIIPELQANIRLIAQEEVEIAALEKDITQSGQELDAQQRKVT